ncbi:hypothetical protein LZK77_16165 [Rhizobium leguminosarum]|nr:hypothetical protein LZK77_16165 [Rhizobium leguminosarum]
MRLHLKLVVACAVAFGQHTIAAEIKAVQISEKQPHLTLRGDIAPGDAERVDSLFKKIDIAAAAAWGGMVIELDSAGGSYDEGLSLAATFRRNGIATVVKKGSKCFSACAIAFLGGSKSLDDPTPTTVDDPLPDQLPSRSLESGGEIGFHAPFLIVPDTEYNSATVQEAYRNAVDAISNLVALADSLYLAAADLPKLLRPTQTELFLADTADAIMFLGIRYRGGWANTLSAGSLRRWCGTFASTSSIMIKAEAALKASLGPSPRLLSLRIVRRSWETVTMPPPTGGSSARTKNAFLPINCSERALTEGASRGAFPTHAM